MKNLTIITTGLFVVPILLTITALCVYALLYVSPDLGQALGVAIALYAVMLASTAVVMLTIGE